MTEKILTEMSDEEIIAEIQALRDRRAQARERRIVEKNEEGMKKKKVVEKVSDSLWDMLGGEEEK